jgi:ATP phosphoribosyltransferase
LRARKSKYILMNVPNDKIDAVGKILPVAKKFNCFAFGTRRME